MSTTQTTNLGLTKATPGTGEPFSTAVVNTNLDTIDSAVGELQDSVDYKREVISIGSSGGYVLALKFGNVVTLYFAFTTSAVADAGTIVALPLDFWPGDDSKDFQLFDVNGAFCRSIRVQTNGTIVPIYGSLPAGKTIRGTFTYIK